MRWASVFGRQAEVGDQQGERLKAIEAETRTALRQTMGSNTFLRYDQLYGGWMQVLETK